MITKNIPKKIIILSSLVVVLSGLYSFYHHDRPRIDALGYDRIGWNLARGYGYIEDEHNIATPEKDWGINRVGPGYQFFLAFIYSLVGHKIWVVWLLHALIRGVSVICIYYLSIVLFPSQEKLGFFAALLFGLSPDLIVVNGLLLTETFFLFLIILAVIASLQTVNRGSKKYALLAGLFYAFSILTRPVAVLPFVAMAGLLLWRKDWKLAICTILLPVLLVGSWSVFVSKRYGTFILTTGVGSYDLWVGNHYSAKGGFEKSPEQLEARYSMNIAELAAYSKKKYFEFLTTAPLKFTEIQIKKAALYFSLIRPAGYWVHLIAHPYQRLLTLFSSLIWTSLLFVGGIAGGFLLLKKRKDLQSRLFLAFVLLQPVAVIPIIVETRYRYTLFPFFAVLTAYFFMKKPINKKVLILAVGILLLFTALDFFYHSQDIVMKVVQVFNF